MNIKIFFLNKKCLSQPMNRIQRKGYRIGTYKINKILFPCFNDKAYIQANRYDGLALSYQS